jgi:hypothetical protein
LILGASLSTVNIRAEDVVDLPGIGRVHLRELPAELRQNMRVPGDEPEYADQEPHYRDLSARAIPIESNQDILPGDLVPRGQEPHEEPKAESRAIEDPTDRRDLSEETVLDGGVVLATLTILTAERLGLRGSLTCRCLDCGTPVELSVLCSACGERRRIADRDAHGHSDACYDPAADLVCLCDSCRTAVDEVTAIGAK